MKAVVLLSRIRKGCAVKEFPSQKEAAKALGLSQTNVNILVNGKISAARIQANKFPDIRFKIPGEEVRADIPSVNSDGVEEKDEEEEEAEGDDEEEEEEEEEEKEVDLVAVAQKREEAQRREKAARRFAKAAANPEKCAAGLAAMAGWLRRPNDAFEVQWDGEW
jgi:hypothetical protein